MNCPRSQQKRSGFTLVELLIAMAVIGILVGMLAYGLMPALRRSREFTIQQEMSQIEQSIEQFKIKYGFYPPSWIRIVNNDFDGNGSVNDIDRINNLLQYINRIAPNHEESVGAVGSRPIDDWWTNVGSNIEFDHGDDLVFWLSALTTSKQFPLTGDGASWPNAYNDGGGFEREVFYDFDSGQLVIEGVTAHYVQSSGKESSFLYIDNVSYGFGPTLSSPIMFDAYSNGLTDGSGNLRYENPDTFQLVTFGMDGDSGLDTSIPIANYDEWTNWARALQGGDDNICNFAQGRLDRMKLGTIVSTN